MTRRREEVAQLALGWRRGVGDQTRRRRRRARAILGGRLMHALVEKVRTEMGRGVAMDVVEEAN
ncbi:hypothetical protein [Azospirillum canadense]|uniref:hypothetical protein n=1 Tax=Azospirillum canadense TaxID=403962 RepID=UPI002227CD10|nr:hypothetical protein [Azospirillum canadense]MCW2242543.1 hypothetical protein [Azospirillum canadense]